jgi:DNA-binding CsgD family transcriptional regulator
MPDLLLTDAEQAALRALVAADAVPGMLPSQEVLENVAVLIPCDAIAIGIADPSGFLVDSVSLPSGTHDRGPRVCDGSRPVGIVHEALDPSHRDGLAAYGLTDGLLIGFRNDRNHIAQLGLDRSKQPFSERDLAVLQMIAPALERLLRNHTTQALPATLTAQERRVLQLVATGLSNTEIADRLYVAPCTIRKHLEHAFRKLGVTNRLAAVIAFEGRHPTDPTGSSRSTDSPERE